MTVDPPVMAIGSGETVGYVDAVASAEGDWTIIVHGWQTDGPDAVYDLSTWQVDTTDASNMTVTAPAVAVLGETRTISVDWSGLPVGERFLGRVAYSNGTDLGGTLVAIRT